MFDLLGQVMRIPLAILRWSAQLMSRTLQSLQPGPAVPAPAGVQVGANPLQAPPPPAGAAYPIAKENPMSDQDLSGDDLKYVRYSILFTKRDLETSLQGDREELVDYSTDGASFGALKISELTARLVQGKVKLPEIWKENDYPAPGSPEYGWELPEADRRYIAFVYSVESRLPVQQSYYERDQVRYLRGIDASLSEINRKFGP